MMINLWNKYKHKADYKKKQKRECNKLYIRLLISWLSANIIFIIVYILMFIKTNDTKILIQISDIFFYIDLYFYLFPFGYLNQVKENWAGNFFTILQDLYLLIMDALDYASSI